MDIKKELERAEKEYNYYKTDYESKIYENIVFSIKYTLNIFCDYLKRKGFIIKTDELVCKATNVDMQFSFKPKYDYKKNPKQVRIIEISKNNLKLNIMTEYQIGIFSDAPLPEPDFSRLLKNPTEGMSNDEILLLEKQKSIKYFKEYVLETELAKYWVYQAENLSEKKDFGYEKDILNHYKKMINR